jgi:hypothetical protein
MTVVGHSIGLTEKEAIMQCMCFGQQQQIGVDDDDDDDFVVCKQHRRRCGNSNVFDALHEHVPRNDNSQVNATFPYVSCLTLKDKKTCL